MKLLTPGALLAALLLSAAAVVPFLPSVQKTTERFALEARLSSSVSGRVQVYYDDGHGFNESNSTSAPVAAGPSIQTCRLVLPPGVYTQLRFDPIDREGTVSLESARIVDRDGRTLRELPLALFKPQHDIQSLRQVEGRLEAVAVPGGNDPQLLVELSPPLRLEVPWSVPAGEWAWRAGVVFAFFVVLLVVLDRAPQARRWLKTQADWMTARPGRGIAMVAALAVAGSAYPVIFLGESYVSPNFGTELLYDGFPTLPGYTQDQVSDVKGSDVGAIMWQQVPFSTIQHRSLLQGELPLWNRYNSAGTPLLGQGQSMFGDPLQLLPIAADGAAWAWDIKYLIAKWLFACGLGLLVFALTRHLPSAFLIALGAPFVGFFLYRINHPAFFSFCYAPWPLYCWVRMTQAKGRRATGEWLAALVLANFALLCSGTVKEAYMLILTMNFAGLCVLLAEPAPARIRLAKLAGAVWAAVLFVLIAAPFWGSFLATLRGAYTNYDAVSAYQIQPGMLLGAFDEAFYRPLSQGGRVFDPSANFLILAGLLYFLASLREHFSNRMVMALAASSLVPLAFAFGLVPPVWIMRTPFLANVAHIDNSFTCGLIVLWAVLAGVGFATAARRLGRPEGRGDLTIAGLLLFALVFGFIAFRQAVQRSVFGPGITFSPLNPGQSIPVSLFVWVYLAVLLAALAAGAGLARNALRRGLTAGGGLGLCLCVGALLWRQGFQAGSGFPDYVAHPPVRTDFQAASDAVDFVRDGTATDPARAIGLQNYLFPGWSGVYGIEGISGPDALINPRYRELSLVAPIQRVWDWRLYLAREDLSLARPFLDFLNVRYYLDLKSDQGAFGAVLKLDRTGDLDVYESPTAWPRAFFTDRISFYTKPEQFVQQILQGDGRPFAATEPEQIRGDPILGSLPDDLSSRTIVPATAYRLTENSTSFDIDAPVAGLVVLSEVYWDGYPRAEVDGRKVPVFRINHIFQGIPIDSAGTHHVTFSYRPKGFPMLLELSAAGLLLLLASGWWVRRPAY